MHSSSELMALLVKGSDKCGVGQLKGCWYDEQLNFNEVQELIPWIGLTCPCNNIEK